MNTAVLVEYEATSVLRQGRLKISPFISPWPIYDPWLFGKDMAFIGGFVDKPKVLCRNKIVKYITIVGIF